MKHERHTKFLHIIVYNRLDLYFTLHKSHANYLCIFSRQKIVLKYSSWHFVDTFKSAFLGILAWHCRLLSWQMNINDKWQKIHGNFISKNRSSKKIIIIKPNIVINKKIMKRVGHFASIISTIFPITAYFMIGRRKELEGYGDFETNIHS